MLCNYVSLLLLTSAVLPGLAEKRYDGHQIWTIDPDSDHHLQALLHLKSLLPQLDFWLEPRQVNQPIHVLVSPEGRSELRNWLQVNGISYGVLKNNVQRVIDNEKRRLSESPETRVYNYDDFNRYDDFMTELDSLAARCNSVGFLCRTEDRGTSWEDRQLKALHIITDDANPYFYMDSLTHAREWLSGATLMNIVNNMINDIDGDSRSYMRRYNWLILPVVNPDGYEFSWDEDRYWRKSRKPNTDSECDGTDLNRNFDSYWANIGSSTNPCAFDYHGEFPADNPETATVQRIGDEFQPAVALSFHTYGYYWLAPYATGAAPPNSVNVTAVTEATCEALVATFGDPWQCGNFRDVLYAASGTTQDYMTDITTSGAYSWTPELRGDDFVVDASEIAPSTEEVWNAMKAKMDTIDALEGIKRS